MSRLFCYILAVSLVSSPGILHAELMTGKELKKKILAEWHSLLEKVITARWEQKIEYHGSRDPKHLRLNRVDVIRRAFNFNAANPGKLWSGEMNSFHEKEAPERRHEVSITNHQYKAELRRSKKNDGWLLTQIKNQEKKAAGNWLKLGDLCPWMRLGIVPIYQLLQEPTLVFIRLEELSGGFFRAYFVNEELQREPFIFVKTGFIDFDPKHSYRPTSYQFKSKSPPQFAKYDTWESTGRGILEYDNAEGIPVLKVVTEEHETRSKRKGLLFGKEITTFTNVQYNGHVSDEEFRLSFYGMPEPQGVVWPKKSRWYLWFIGFGVLTLVVGRYFWRRVEWRKILSGQGSKNPKGDF